MKLDWKPTAIVLAFAALSTAAFLLSIKYQQSFIFRPPQIYQTANLDSAYNKNALVDGAVSSVAIEMYLQALAPSVSDPERKLELIPQGNIVTYVRDDNPNLDVEQVCVESITLMIDSPRVRAHNFLKEPLCHTYVKEDWFGDYAYDLSGGDKYLLTNHWYVELPYQPVPFTLDNPDVIGVNFWFPYDGFKLKLYVQAVTSITLSDKTVKTETIPIYYEWKLQSSGSRPWDIAMRNETFQFTTDSENVFVAENFEPGYYQQTEIDLQRTSLYLFAFPILLTAMILLISLIPLFVDSNIESIFGVQTGLMFATFALRAILSPGREIGQTLIEVSVIGLNLLQIFSTTILFVRKVQKGRSENAEKDTPKPA